MSGQPRIGATVEGVELVAEPSIPLRDYFAAQASEEDVREQGEVIRVQQIASVGLAILPDGWRTRARYMHADEMLKARQS